MSKYRTTKKEMNEGYTHIVGTGYCNLQYLLRFEEPFAYSTRAEGWSCDYYDIDDVLICTGYAPMRSKRTKSNYQIENEYDEKAREIYNNQNLSWEEQKEQIETLLHEYIKAVKK